MTGFVQENKEIISAIYEKMTVQRVFLRVSIMIEYFS